MPWSCQLLHTALSLMLNWNQAGTMSCWHWTQAMVWHWLTITIHNPCVTIVSNDATLHWHCSSWSKERKGCSGSLAWDATKGIIQGFVTWNTINPSPMNESVKNKQRLHEIFTMANPNTDTDTDAFWFHANETSNPPGLSLQPLHCSHNNLQHNKAIAHCIRLLQKKQNIS